MKFKISTLELQKAIKIVGVAANINAVDMSGKMHIIVKEDVVVFNIVGYTMSVTYTAAECDIIEIGEVLVEYNKIKSFVSSFKAWNEESGVKEFIFVLDKSFIIKVNNVHKDGTFSTGILKLQPYTPQSSIEDTFITSPTFTLDANDFMTATSKVLYAINPLEFNIKVISGMNIVFSDDIISFVGTDGRSLSEYIVKNDGDFKDEDFIVKYDFIMGVRRIVNKDTKMFWKVSNNKIQVFFDNILFSGSKVISGDYPPYSDVFSQYENEVLLGKQIMLESLAPFKDLLEQEDNNRLTFSIHGDTLCFKSPALNFETKQDIDNVALVIDVDGGLLVKAIEHIKSDRLRMYYSNADGVLIFDAEEGYSQKALITPLKFR